MNQEIKQKWIDALRSGEYEQGRSFLRNERGQYCCLGVLCEVAGFDIEKNQEYLNEEDAHFAGLLGIDPEIDHSRFDSLAAANDGFTTDDRLTFPEIADLIERQF